MLSGISQVTNSGIMKRISVRPDVKNAHTEGRDTRNRSCIRLNISKSRIRSEMKTLQVWVRWDERKNKSGKVLNELNSDDAVRWGNMMHWYNNAVQLSIR